MFFASIILNFFQDAKKRGCLSTPPSFRTICFRNNICVRFPRGGSIVPLFFRQKFLFRRRSDRSDARNDARSSTFFHSRGDSPGCRRNTPTVQTAIILNPYKISPLLCCYITSAKKAKTISKIHPSK